MTIGQIVLLFVLYLLGALSVANIILAFFFSPQSNWNLLAVHESSSPQPFVIGFNS